MEAHLTALGRLIRVKAVCFGVSYPGKALRLSYPYSVLITSWTAPKRCFYLKVSVLLAFEPKRLLRLVPKRPD